MIVYQTNFGPVKRFIIWSPGPSFKIPASVLRAKPDIVHIYGVPMSDDVVQTKHFESLTYVYDFPEGETSNDLLGRLGKDTRRDIRLCQKDDRISVQTYSGALIPKHLLKAACKTSDEMFKSKGLNTKLRLRPFLDQIKAGTLYLSVSYYERVPCVFHAYSIDGRNAICCLIATSFRQRNLDKKTSAMIHRYHSFCDMGHFQDAGYSHFDWGGITSSTNPNGIDRFKMRFPGYQCVKADTFICFTLKGRLFARMKHLPI